MNLRHGSFISQRARGSSDQVVTSASPRTGHREVTIPVLQLRAAAARPAASYLSARTNGEMSGKRKLARFGNCAAATLKTGMITQVKTRNATP